MAEIGRYKPHVLFTEDCTSINDLRDKGTVSSAPTLADGPLGKDVASFDGTDDKVAFVGSFGGVQTIAIRVYLSSTTEQVIDLDGGTHYIDVTGGTVAANGFTSPTIYVDGSAGTTITAAAWHSIVVTTGTAFTASSVQLATDNTDFGQVRLGYLIVDNRAWSAGEALAYHDNSMFDYDRTLVSRWDLSEINPQDIGFAGNGNNGTGTGLVASTDIVDGPYGGGKAIEFDGTEYVTVANGGSFAASTLEAFSVVMLYKSTVASRRTLAVQGDAGAGNHGWIFGLNTGGLLTMSVLQSDGSGHLDSADTVASNDGSWHVATASAAINDSIYLYRDGALVGSDTSSTGSANAAPSASLLVCGTYGSWAPFIGVIAEMRVYSSQLLQMQHQDINLRLRREVS
jgi:hypothetical protein